MTDSLTDGALAGYIFIEDTCQNIDRLQFTLPILDGSSTVFLGQIFRHIYHGYLYHSPTIPSVRRTRRRIFSSQVEIPSCRTFKALVEGPLCQGVVRYLLYAIEEMECYQE